MAITARAFPAVITCAFLAASAALVAGPLTPPAGLVAPTYRTLAEVQPRIPVQSLPGDADALHIISQPGSYYLTGNIAVTAADVSAIRVRASDVTIDLCGFEIDGGGVGKTAIDAQVSADGLSVRNGSLANWQYAGVDAAYCSGALLDSLRVRAGGQVALDAGRASVVRHCTTQGAGIGIVTTSGGHIVDCAAGGAEVGIFVCWGSSLTRSTASNCTYGIGAVGQDCSITDCTVRGGNSGISLDGSCHRVERCKIGQVLDGISAFFTCTIVNNSVSAATAGQGTGIYAGVESGRVEGNHVYAFDRGIRTSGTTNVITANTMHSCTQPISGTVSAMVAPVVTTAAQLAANPIANIAQ